MCTREVRRADQRGDRAGPKRAGQVDKGREAHRQKGEYNGETVIYPSQHQRVEELDGVDLDRPLANLEIQAELEYLADRVKLKCCKNSRNHLNDDLNGRSMILDCDEK